MTPERRAVPKWVLATLVPVLAWALMQAWSTKVNAADFDVHTRDEAVQMQLLRDEIHEVLCTVKPESHECL